MVCPPSRFSVASCLWSDDCGVTHVIHQGEVESIQESVLLGEHCLLTTTISTWCVLRSEWVPSTKLLKTLWRHMPEFRFSWVRRRCGTVEVTTHLGVARCKGLQNVLIRGESMDCSSVVSLVGG